MSGWAQVALLVLLSLAAVAVLMWTLRRAWLSDEYRGTRRRSGALRADQVDGGTGEYGVLPSTGRHRRDGGPDEVTRPLDPTGVWAARARVGPPPQWRGARPPWLR